LIVVETETSADVNFERETSLYTKVAKKKPVQTLGHSGAKPKIRKLTLNAADIYSNVDKRKGSCTVDYIVSLYVWVIYLSLLNKTLKALNVTFNF